MVTLPERILGDLERWATAQRAVGASALRKSSTWARNSSVRSIIG
jgi:hypothetical protein